MSKNSFDVGLQSEDVVARFYLQKNYKILAQRWRTPFAEVDLLLRSQEGELVVCEVKHIQCLDYLEIRMTKKQKERLRKLLNILSEAGMEVEFHYVLVNQGSIVEIFRDILSG